MVDEQANILMPQLFQDSSRSSQEINILVDGKDWGDRVFLGNFSCDGGITCIWSRNLSIENGKK